MGADMDEGHEGDCDPSKEKGNTKQKVTGGRGKKQDAVTATAAPETMPRTASLRVRKPREQQSEICRVFSEVTLSNKPDRQQGMKSIILNCNSADPDLMKQALTVLKSSLAVTIAHRNKSSQPMVRL
jgi:hypothetical protein